MRAPTYQSQTRAPQGSNTRLVASEEGGVGAGIARGLQAAGRGLGQYAEAEFKIQERHNDISARRLELEARQKIQPLLSEYQTLRGINATDAANNVLKQIDEIRDKIGEGASNPRMRDLYFRRTDEQLAAYKGAVIDHTFKQQWQADWDTATSELANAQAEAAIGWRDLKVFGERLREVDSIASSLSTLAGDTPEIAENRRRGARTQIVTTVIDEMLKDPTSDLDVAIGFFEEHRGSLTAQGISNIAGALAEPIANRWADGMLNEIVSGVIPSPADAAAGGGVSSSSPASTAPMQMPVGNARVSSGYGMRTHPTEGGRKMHYGIDFAAPAGSSIKPAADGVVSRNFWDEKGGGWVVSIKHADGHETSYLHMGQASPYKKGDRVTRSTVIGRVGSTGSSTGPHLDFRVKNRQGEWIDPNEYLKGSTPIGSADEPGAWDTASTLEAINAREDRGELTAEQADLVRKRFMRRVNRDEAVIEQRDRDAVEAAQEWMLVPGNLDNFTSFDQLPANVRAGLSPATALRFTEVAAQNRNALESANVAAVKEARDLEYVALAAIKSNDADTFAALDLTKYAGKVESDKLVGLMNDQIALKQKRAQGVLEFDPGPLTKSTIKSMSLADGDASIKEGTAKFNALSVIMADRANAFIKENNGKLPTAVDFQDFYRYATAKVPVKYSRAVTNLFMGSTGEERRFEVEGTVEAATKRVEQTTAERSAARERNRLISNINAEFMRSKGRYPNPEELARRLALAEGQ